MAQHCYVVYSAAVVGREAEYHRWYDGQHLADVLAVPGFVAAQRFRPAAPASGDAGRCLAVYEIGAADPSQPMAELMRRVESGEMHMSPAMDMATVSATLFTAIGARVCEERNP